MRATPHSHLHKTRDGFTLIELVVVLTIMAVVSAVALPQFVPLIAFSQLEGTARHLGNYGEGAIAHATLMREDITVRVDFDNQEYYTIRWIVPDAEGEGAAEAEAAFDQLAMFNEFRQGSELSPGELSDLLAEGKLQDMPENFDPEAADLQMNDRFAKWQRSITTARAKNVIHDESFLDDIGNFVDEVQFDLDEEMAEPVEEEIYDPVLERTRPFGDAYIESVSIDGESISSGVAEINLTALGLSNYVRFFVTDGYEYYTIVWDPVTGTANVIPGKVDE